MPVKTILHVIDTTGPGGAETIFVNLADRMRERGYRSVVVIQGEGWVHDELLRRGLAPLVINAKGAFNLRLLVRLVSVVHRERVDVIHSHLLGSNVYCAMAGLLTGIPVIATFHGMVDAAPNERLQWLKLALMNRGVEYFVAVSNSLREAIGAKGLLNPDRTHVIYNGIDISRYGKSTRRELRDRLGLSHGAIVVGSLGNVRPAKGYDILINAARAVIDRFPSVHFVIAGHVGPSELAAMNQLATEQGVLEHVHFLGYQDNSAEFLSQLDYFVLSSTSEGFSISTIEAMATGLPILVTRCGGPEEIVRPNVDGLMAAPGDPREISRGLLSLISDTQSARRVAASGREEVKEIFSEDNMLRRYAALYESCLRKAPSARR